MAKKVKQKKSGMIRRQQKKRHQKRIRRRLLMPTRHKNNFESPENIEQLLNALPTLAFEQELADLLMDKSEMKLLIEKKLTEIDIFSKLITDSFVLELTSRLSQIVELNPEKSEKTILAKATLHQIENKSEIPYISNPLIIAIFLKTKAYLEKEEMNIQDITKAINSFNLRNEKTLNSISENFEDDSIVKNNELSEKDPLAEKIIPVIEKTVYKKFLETFKNDKKQRIEDDLDVFFTDFKPPPLEEWNLNLIKNFIEKWFIENANPMAEDIESMKESILDLIEFLTKERLISKNFLPEVSNYIKQN